MNFIDLRYKVKRISKLIISLLVIFILIFDTATFVYASGATRGGSGDLWADKILGKRSFGELSPRGVVPDKLSSPGGVIVDKSGGGPGRAYIWDSGNSRILGIDLATC